MKAIKAAFWILAIGILVVPAMARTVNMQFTGLPTGNNYWGVASYPYDVSVDGGPNQLMMCIGYYEHIEGGETWKADVISIGSLDPTTHLLDYEAAYLFKQAVATGGGDPNLNAAAWYIFEGAPGLTPEAQAWVTLAQNQIYTKGEFADIFLFKAIPGTESGNIGTAQDFLASTPEPTTLMMCGTGIIGLAGVLRRKLRA